jgi:hypothetical protein
MDPATGRFYREALGSDEHRIEGESSAFETAVQTTVGIGVGLFRLAFGGVAFLIVVGVVAVGCLVLVS